MPIPTVPRSAPAGEQLLRPGLPFLVGLVVAVALVLAIVVAVAVGPAPTGRILAPGHDRLPGLPSAHV
ncbi:hypothetical protein [Intrasporangium sp.]|uniref:hypothetical protein n=1 Tax=Intrasporangium sp. TaxID=1925024 RepID=UPI002939E7EF|nr:hypothetical protein [Intrasporangium sp.]MDV3220394.1 hypothetical protein [Intrasporangium sp.]